VRVLRSTPHSPCWTATRQRNAWRRLRPVRSSLTTNDPDACVDPPFYLIPPRWMRCETSLMLSSFQTLASTLTLALILTVRQTCH